MKTVSLAVTIGVTPCFFRGQTCRSNCIDASRPHTMTFTAPVMTTPPWDEIVPMCANPRLPATLTPSDYGHGFTGGGTKGGGFLIPSISARVTTAFNRKQSISASTDWNLPSWNGSPKIGSRLFSSSNA